MVVLLLLWWLLLFTVIFVLLLITISSIIYFVKVKLLQTLASACRLTRAWNVLQIWPMFTFFTQKCDPRQNKIENIITSTLIPNKTHLIKRRKKITTLASTPPIFDFNTREWEKYPSSVSYSSTNLQIMEIVQHYTRRPQGHISLLHRQSCHTQRIRLEPSPGTWIHGDKSCTKTLWIKPQADKANYRPGDVSYRASHAAAEWLTHSGR